jgi:uncharacterized protein (DUF1015 family)
VAGRRRLMAATEANLEPILLVYDGGRGEETADRQAPTASEIVDEVANWRTPLLSIQTADGVTHRLWRLDNPAEYQQIAADLASRPALIADGHHRYAAYLQLQAEMRAAGRGEGPWDYGLAFLVDSVAYPPRLGAIHRVLPSLDLDRLAEQKGTAFLLAGAGSTGETRYRLLSRPDPAQVAASMPPGVSVSWQGLDASIMQQLLLGRLWGITDNEDDVLIYHDAAEAVAAASTGTAVILNPVPFEAVRDIAEHGERVPRKSTSFGPKPVTGLVLRTFGPRRQAD